MNFSTAVYSTDVIKSAVGHIPLKGNSFALTSEIDHDNISLGVLITHGGFPGAQ